MLLASKLRPVYQLMLVHESGEWKVAAELSSSLHLDSEDVAGLYWQAQQWAREVANGESDSLRRPGESAVWKRKNPFSHVLLCKRWVG